MTAGTGIAISDETVSLNAGLNDLNDVITEKNSLHLGKETTSDSGGSNVSVGQTSMRSITSGSRNTSVGFNSASSLAEEQRMLP